MRAEIHAHVCREFSHFHYRFDLFDPVVLSEYNISSREEILRSYYNVQLIGTNFAYIYSKCEAFLSFLDVPPSISDTVCVRLDVEKFHQKLFMSIYLLRSL